MYILSLLSFGNFILFLLYCLYIIKLRPVKPELNKYAFVVCVSLGIWNLCYTVFYGTTDRDIAWIFYKIATIGMYSFPVFVLKFFLVLTKRQKILSSSLNKIMLNVPGVALIMYVLFSKTSPLADDLVLSRLGLGWTYVNHIGKVSFWVTLLYLMIYLGISLYILYLWEKESKYQVEKKQARLFLIGDGIVLFAGVMTDFIMPLFGSQIPPMANIFTIIFIIFFYYIIRRLKVFNISQVASSKLIMNTLMEPILVLDSYGKIIQINTATECAFGFSRDFLQGKKLSEVLPDNIEMEEMDYGETIIKNRLKEDIYVIFSKTQVWDQWKGYLGTVIHLKDITQMKQEENKLRTINSKYTRAAEKLEQIANYDTLTGIPNRRMLVRTLSERIRNSENNGNDFGLIFMDLNGFKEINDNWGHNIGDKVLKLIALRLQSLLKPKDMIARLGGDEFVMLVNFNKKEEINQRSKDIQTLVAEPMNIEKLICQISIATGISIYSENTFSMENMIRLADLAMYEHKRHQKK